MKNKLGSRLLIAAALGALTACSGLGKDQGSGAGSGDTGSVNLEVAIAPGLNLDAVNYSVEVPGHDPIKGSFPIAENGVVSGSLDNVPAGDSVKIGLTASNGNGTTCEGSGTVAVKAGETTSVSIVLQCRLPDGSIVTTGGISVKASVNVCPQLLTATATVGADGTIEVSATAKDLDEDSLSFQWAAKSGSFADEDAPSTTYTCDGAGEQTFTATVTDSDGCSHSKDVKVACQPATMDAGAANEDAGAANEDAGAAEQDAGAVLDSGTSKPADVGASLDAGSSAPDAGASEADAGAGADAGSSAPPAAPLCTGTPANACEECACSSCTTEMDACKALAGNAAEGPAAGQPKSELCQAVVRCGQAAGCRGTACYCGTADLVSCLTGSADGPCMAEINAAAETTDVVTLQGRQTSTTYAVGLANQVSTCSENSCADTCGTTPSVM